LSFGTLASGRRQSSDRACRDADIAVTVRMVSFDRTVEPLRFGLGQAAHLPFLHGYEERLETLVRNGAVSFAEDRQLCTGNCTWPTFRSCCRARRGEIAQAACDPVRCSFAGAEPGDVDSEFAYPDPRSPGSGPAMRSGHLFPEHDAAGGSVAGGFYVGRGYATGEKEETTIAANRLELLRSPLTRDWLRRVRRSTAAEPLWRVSSGGRVFCRRPTGNC